VGWNASDATTRVKATLNKSQRRLALRLGTECKAQAAPMAWAMGQDWQRRTPPKSTDASAERGVFIALP
jgi:hypothetical protein